MFAHYCFTTTGIHQIPFFPFAFIYFLFVFSNYGDGGFPADRSELIPLTRVEVTDHLDTRVSQQCFYHYNVSV